MILIPVKTRQEAKSYGQSLQKGIYQAQQCRQEARDRGQSRRKPNMTDSLCRKRKLADSFIPVNTYMHVLENPLLSKSIGSYFSLNFNPVISNY